MPVNKNSLIRYRLIDKRLREKYKPYPSKEDLVEYVSEQMGVPVSESTIEKDLKAMRQDRQLGYLAPIAYHRDRKGYFYTDENYSIAQVALSEDDLDAIKFSTIVLQQFSEHPLFSRYADAVDRIVDAINLRDVLDTGEENFIMMEQVERQVGVNWLTPLIQAIRDRQVVRISYQRFEAEDEKEHLMHPYLLREYRNRWYLVGMHDKREFIYTLALDRIRDVESLPSERFPYKRKPDFDARKYFQNVIGITVINEPPRNIILEFRGKSKDYVKSLPWHHSQKIIREEEDKVVIGLYLVPTPELKMSILAAGRDVKVLEPVDLAKEIRDTALDVEKMYRI